jgi:hypothetical protein
MAEGIRSPNLPLGTTIGEFVGHEITGGVRSLKRFTSDSVLGPIQSAVDDAIASILSSSSNVSSRTALKAIDTGITKSIYLTEAGREGYFIFQSGDYSSKIVSDTAGGVFIKADDTASSAGAWVRIYSGAVDVRWFGAKGDGVADDTTALQAACDFVSPGGAIRIASGIYCYTTLVLDDAIGLRVDGEGALAKTILRCTSTTASGGVKVRSTFDVTFNFVTFDHSSSSFTGYLVDSSHAPSGFTGDTQGLYFFRCAFASKGYNLYSAKGINIDQSTVVTFDGCKFVSLVRPIDGQASAGGSYSNVVRVINCQFFDNVGYCFNYPGEGWRIEGCNFQACHDGAQRIVYSASTTPWRSLTFVNCTAYDATAAGTVYFLLDKGEGLSVIGGMYGGRSDLGASTFLSATGIIQGVHIAGCFWSLFSPVFSAAVSGNKAWHVDLGNITKTCATFSSGGANISPALSSTYVAVIP